MSYTFFIHLCVSGNLDWLNFLPIVNSMAMNMIMQLSLGVVMKSSLEFIPRKDIAGSYGGSAFSFWSNCILKWLH